VNQKSAWWKEDDRLVRWGHLDGFADTRTFAFMISLGVARKLQARLAAGEEIVFNAEIRAHLREGRYALVSAVIPGAVTPGADPELATEEIVYSSAAAQPALHLAGRDRGLDYLPELFRQHRAHQGQYPSRYGGWRGRDQVSIPHFRRADEPAHVYC